MLSLITTHRSDPKRLFTLLLASLLLTMVMVLPPVCAQASFGLTNGNSALSVDPATGAQGWTVDGINQLAGQMWFYRIGDTNQAPLSMLGAATVNQLSPDVLDVRYTGQSIDLLLRYTLIGGLDGSGNSTVAESMRIKNKTAQPLAFHLFEYTDLDLNGTPDDDVAALLSATTVGQWDGGVISTETASAGGMTPTPNHWEVDNAATLLAKLTGAPVVNLADASTPFTGNAAFAFQWDMDIAPGATQLLSKSKILMRGGAIGDTVWYDSNGDGIQDKDELGIPNVKVSLTADFDNDGVVDYTTSTVTDEAGYYLFPNLPAGHYVVTVDHSTLPAGATQTYDLDGLDTPDSATIDLATSEVNLDVDFGYWQLASLGDRVWKDCNGNGVQDAGEKGISGVKVTLEDSEGEVVGTATTTGDGNYSFDNLIPSSYTVVVDASTLPAGLVQTYDLDRQLDNTAQVTLAAGDHRTDVDFGYTCGKPGISLVKTGPASAKAGETITYHFVVTNTGGMTLYWVWVNDPMLGGKVWCTNSMAPGEKAEFDRTYVVKSAASGGCGSLCVKPPTCGGGDYIINTATAEGWVSMCQSVTSTSSWKTTILKCSSYRTYTQGGWGACPHGSNAGMLLLNNFWKVYPCGKVKIGGWYSVTFTSPQAIYWFLPQGGPPRTLKCCATNPCSTAAGVFAGQVLALKLNVDFSNAGVTCPGLSSVKLQSGALRGRTIGEVLDLAQRVLGGDTCALPWGMSVCELNSIVDGINNLYDK